MHRNAIGGRVRNPIRHPMHQFPHSASKAAGTARREPPLPSENLS
jgi:hypothetical protein